MLVSELHTPVPTCHLDILERNIEKYQDMLTGSGLKVRSHMKTHQVPAIAICEKGQCSCLCWFRSEEGRRWMGSAAGAYDGPSPPGRPFLFV